MKLTLVAFLLFVSNLSSAANAAGVCYLRKVENNILQLTSREPSKDEQVQLVRENTQMFCEKNMELRFLNVNPKISKALGFNCETTREEKLDEVVNTALFFEYQNSALDGLGGSGYQPWFSSLIPTQFAQDLTLGNSNSLNASAFATKSYEMDVAGFSKFVESNRADVLKTMAELFSKKPILSFNSDSSGNFYARALRKNSSGIEDNVAVQGAICGDLSVTTTISCVSALRRLLDLARPVFIEKMSYMPVMVWEKFFLNEKFYAEGLRRASLKIIGRIQDNKKKLGFILEDLTSSFQESGLSPNLSLDAAYDVLALYGNGGANLGERISRLSLQDSSRRSVISSHYCAAFTNSVCGYLNIIGKAIPILDYQSLRDHGALYSLPKTANSRCNNQKSYYFWLNAFLTRQLVKEGFDAKSAILAAYALTIGYQFNRDQGVINAPNRGARALSRSSFDPVNNVIRSDLAYAYAGSIFGAENKIISVDETLIRLMEASQEVEPESFDTSSLIDLGKKYIQFRKLISPSAALKER